MQEGSTDTTAAPDTYKNEDEWGEFKTDKHTPEDKWSRAVPTTNQQVGHEEDWGDFTGEKVEAERRKETNDDWGTFIEGGGLGEEILERKIPSLFFEGTEEDLNEAIARVFAQAFPTDEEGGLESVPEFDELVARSEFRYYCTFGFPST